MMKKIKVNLRKNTYEILIQDGLLNNCGPLLKKHVGLKKTAILSNPIVFKLHGKKLVSSLKKMGLKTVPIIISDGERYKNPISLFYVLKILARNGFNRDSVLFTLGGGVIGDLGGLTASLYMRGINFVQCPTTFLAQVDASVGGKTAIDFDGIKNLVGTFYQPKLVLIDPTLLQTLDDRQIRTGLAEVIKYGVIQDEKLFNLIDEKINQILKRDKVLLSYLTFKSCEIKARIVSEDEKETGRRIWLNYGHSVGHALESYFNYKVLTHGEAISYGMSFAALLSFKLGLCSKDVLIRQNRLIQKAGMFIKLPYFDPEKVYQKILLDKKTLNDGIQFILTRKIGLVTIQKNIPKSTVLTVLTQLNVRAKESY